MPAVLLLPTKAARPCRAGPALNARRRSSRYSIETATNRTSPCALATRSSADLRPSFFSASSRLVTSAGRGDRLLADLDDDLAGLDALVGGGRVGIDAGDDDALQVVLEAEAPAQFVGDAATG